MSFDEIDEEYVEHDLPFEEEKDDLGPAYGRPVPFGGIPRQFKPWHRPRKQYVRRKQWVSSFADLLNELCRRDSDRRDASYIGLPGSDLLDVRLFAEECAARALKLRYLGFDRTATGESAESAYLNLSRDELSKSGNVHRESLVMPDEFSQLGDVRSLAYTTANRMSFDVVNLDLCGSATNEPAGQDNTIYPALKNVLRVQAKREEPWLLLFTATFGKDTQSNHGQSNAENLVRALKERLEECASAEAAAQDIFERGEGSGLPELDECDHDGYSKLLVLAFISWLCSVGRGIRSSRFRVVSVMNYRVNRYLLAPNMFSLAIRVTPQEPTVRDAAGLLQEPRPVDECEELTQHARRMSRVVDADEALRSNDALFDAMRAEMADLLADLRYDRQEYLSSDFSKLIEDTEAEDAPETQLGSQVSARRAAGVRTETGVS
ncbi:hypothetical protein [Micromonospora sp. KC723]|uniref:PP_RS20740 family protein n=1 Tax=Micromonospora sp. KC723 TaxID=2530381 RepID=UPI00104A41C0|nr:hypothetical protein [Micromonospora sp. KC723]TDB75211.1 hypothetical protein E1165_11860 [Micromonospora sp. KC723]